MMRALEITLGSLRVGVLRSIESGVALHAVQYLAHWRCD